MVSETEPVRVIVEISRAEPFRGTIAERNMPLRTFNGWTAFAAGIAAIVRRIGAARADEGPDEVTGG
jgi:hypothetical protein